MMPLIPFRWMPGSWGLKGRAYDEAEAYYELTGEALERRLAVIRSEGDMVVQTEALADLEVKYGHMTAYERDQLMSDQSPEALADIDLKHGRIEPYEFEHRMLELADMPERERMLAKLNVDHRFELLSDYEYDQAVARLEHAEGTDREVALLDVELAHGKIDKSAHDKQVATLREEPWIGIIDQGFDPDQGVNGIYFEFDWNRFWIEYLRLNGYVGQTDEQLVEQWFSDVCRAQADAANGVTGAPSMLIPLDGGTPFS